jgi:hypothetical protein
MSARKLENPSIFNPVTVQSPTTRLDLQPSAVTIRKNGIEFRTQQPIPAWTEMTVALETPNDSRKVHCTGVVVECNGNAQSGYVVSMIFTDLTRQAQARLNSYADSRLG